MGGGQVRVGEGEPAGVIVNGRIRADADVRFVRAKTVRGRAPPPAPIEQEAAPDVVPAKGRRRPRPGADDPGGVIVPIVNRPARFPPSPLWPVELRADLAAAMLDFQTTRALCKAVQAGEAPPPTSVRGTGRRAEPVWSLGAVQDFVARRHGLA